MADPKGFLKHPQELPKRRPVDEKLWSFPGIVLAGDEELARRVVGMVSVMA